MRNERGFTLIELLVVVIILGILAAVVVFAVSGLNEDTQGSACEIDERTVRTAAEAYYASEGSYPANEAAMVPTFLNEESSLMTYTLVAGPPQSYTVAPQAGGDCV